MTRTEAKEKLMERLRIIIAMNAHVGTNNTEACSGFDEFMNGDHLNIEELFQLGKTLEQKNIDTSELEKCMMIHQTDLELRSCLLSYTSLKLRYSKHTTPEYGIARAKNFLREWELEEKKASKKIKQLKKTNQK